MLVAVGHDLDSLAELVIPLKTEKELTYSKEYTSDGVARNVGGATMTLIATSIEFDEAEDILDQLGLSLETPSRLITVAVPDERRQYRPWYGVVTLNVESTDNGLWKDFRLDFTGLVPVA